MGINENNEYFKAFETNNYQKADDNGFIYVNSGNQYDKDVWNYNTLQTNLKITDINNNLITINYTLTGINYTNTGKATVITNDKIHIKGNRNINSYTPENTWVEINCGGVGPAFQTKYLNKTVLTSQNWKTGTPNQDNPQGIAIYHDGQLYNTRIYTMGIYFRRNNKDTSSETGTVGFERAACPGDAERDGAITVLKNGGTTHFRAAKFFADSAFVCGSQEISNTGIIGGMYLRPNYIGNPVAGNNCIFGSTGTKDAQSIRTNYMYSDNGYGSGSDKKLKNHIKYINVGNDFLNYYMNIKPVLFTYKNSEIYGNQKNMGVYAQELFKTTEQTVGDFLFYSIKSKSQPALKTEELRDLVLQNKISDEDLEWSVDYTKLITPTIAMVQFQQKEIEKLKLEIKELKSKLN